MDVVADNSEETEADLDIDALVKSWQPTQSSDVMQRAFAERCRWIEVSLQVRADADRDAGAKLVFRASYRINLSGGAWQAST